MIAKIKKTACECTYIPGQRSFVAAKSAFSF